MRCKDIQKSSIIATFSCILMCFKMKFALITRETVILDRLLNKNVYLCIIKREYCYKMELKALIAECTAYDFKVMLEEKKPKSWLKSVSAFANGMGGSLFFGIDNDGIVKGLDDVQYVCEAISSKIRDYMDPLPEVEMIPHDIDGLHILQLKVNAGHYTPYYYVGDGQRIAFVRVGDESIPATAEQMVRLVLKGSNKTYDSIHTDYKVEDNAFTILANTFKDRTKQEWDKKYLLSFGLVTGIGNLTNAGALFADDCPLWQSRLYCTRWDGKEKGDAINDAEFTGNVLMLLREAMNFVKSNTKRGWEKLPNGRKNKPEYAERAVLEAMVNHFLCKCLHKQLYVKSFIM